MITIRDISRTGHITRWHMVRTQRDQTLAEHLYLVTMYAIELAEQILTDFDSDSKLALMSWCLEHDTPEILTGDIPTPAKRRIQESLGTLDLNPLEDLEYSIANASYKEAKDKIKDSKLEIIAKLADVMDGLVFIHVEGVTEHSTIIEHKLTASFGKVISLGRAKYPNEKWGKAEGILNEILFGRDGQIEFESDY